MGITSEFAKTSSRAGKYNQLQPAKIHQGHLDDGDPINMTSTETTPASC